MSSGSRGMWRNMYASLVRVGMEKELLSINLGCVDHQHYPQGRPMRHEACSSVKISLPHIWSLAGSCCSYGFQGPGQFGEYLNH